MKDPNCAYCMQGDMAAAFAYPVCEMNTSFLYIFKEQSKRGRCVIAHKKHVSELIDLTAEERTAFSPMWRRQPMPFIRHSNLIS